MALDLSGFDIPLVIKTIRSLSATHHKLIDCVFGGLSWNVQLNEHP